MFFHLQYIHLFRPFLKYAPSTSPLPAHVSPRRICTANAGNISKLMRLYKKTWNLRQICNIAVYMLHSACTIHLLNLPEKTARRDITHGIRHLEEIAEDWLCARRTLSILSILAKKWNCEMPEDATVVLQRTDAKYGSYANSDTSSPRSQSMASPSLSDRVPGGRSSVEGAMMMSHPFGHSQLPHPPPRPGPMVRGLSMMSHSSDPLSQSPSIHGGLGTPLVGTPPPGMIHPPGVDSMGCWNSQPQHLTSMPFPPVFSGVPPAPSSTTSSMGHNGEPTSMPSQHSFRQHGHASSGSISMDSPDWFLRDSVHWQQSFESWETQNNSGHNSNGGHGQMFMFGGDNRSTPSEGRGELSQMEGFDALGSTLNNGNWLPNLE